MRHLGPCGSRRQRRPARIGEEVEHAQGGLRHGRNGTGTLRAGRRAALRRRHGTAAARTAAVVDEVPVGRLFGEDTHVLERRKAQPHAQPHRPVGILHRPAVGHLRRKAPLAALLLPGVAAERRIGQTPPLLLGKRRAPDGLRFGTARHEAAEAFELLEGARVDEFIIPEIGCELSLHGIRKKGDRNRPQRGFRSAGSETFICAPAS